MWVMGLAGTTKMRLPTVPEGGSRAVWDRLGEPRHGGVDPTEIACQQ